MLASDALVLNDEDRIKTNTLKLTVFVHFYVETFLQPAGLALVPSRYIHMTIPILFTLIAQAAANASLEKSSTTITREDSVVLSG